MPGEAFLLGMPGRLRDGPHDGEGRDRLRAQPRRCRRTWRRSGSTTPTTGACLAFMDGTYITAIRTSAAAAVAADQLAREDARTLAIIGAGVQGEHHLRPSRSCATSTRSGSARLSATMRTGSPRCTRGRTRWTIPRRRSAARTWSRSPPTPRSRSSTPDWIAPGTHVSSVGYHPPDGELPRALLDRATLFVETLRGVRAAAGRLRRAPGPHRRARARRRTRAHERATRSPSTRRWAT